MGKRSREKRDRMVRAADKDVIEERFEPKTQLEELCLFVIKAMTYFALLTPLIMSGNFFFPFVSPKSLYFMGFAQVIFFTWLFLIFYFPQYRPRKNPVLISLILFLIVLILSSIFGENFSNSFWSKPERMTGLLMWFHLYAFFLVISSVFRRKEDWLKIFSVSAVIGVILGIIALSATSPAMRGGATLGNTSFLGTCFVFLLFIALYLVFSSKKEIKFQDIYKWGGFICFLIILLSFILMDGARMAKLSFLSGLVLLFFLWLIFRQKGILKWVGVCFLAVFVISTFYFVFSVVQPDSFIRKEIAERFIGKDYMETIGGRLPTWQTSWDGFSEKPFLGWGPENFENSFIRHYDPCMGTPRCGGDIWYDRAHNIFFDTLVATGLLGMLAYIGIFFSVFYVLWKNYLKKTIKFWTAGIFSVLLVAYFIQNLTVFDMVSSYLMFFLVLGFAVGITTPERESASRKFISPGPWAFTLVLFLFIPTFFYFIIQPMRTSHYAVAALRAQPASVERLDLYKKTLETSPLGKYQIREFFGQQTLQLAQSEKVKEALAENFKKEIDFVVEELEKSIKESPLDFRSYLTLGKLYNAYAILLDPIKISEAEKVLQKAIEVSPTNQQGYWALAQTRLYQGRTDEALSLAEKALDLEPQLFQAHLIIIQIAKIIEDQELTERKIQEAVEINPEWEATLTEML